MSEPDVVYHLADVVAGIDYVFSNEAFVFRQNVLINSNVFKCCSESGVEATIYVGTACSFPAHLQAKRNGVVALREDQTYPASPESSYGWSKLMGEYEGELAQKTGKLNVGILRLHNVYGGGIDYYNEKVAKTLQVLPALCLKAIESTRNTDSSDRKLSVYGSGYQYRDFVHVSDVVRALLLCKSRGMGKGVVQIGTGEATIAYSARMVAQLARKHLGTPVYSTPRRQCQEGDRGRTHCCPRPCAQRAGMGAPRMPRRGTGRSISFLC